MGAVVSGSARSRSRSRSRKRRTMPFDHERLEVYQVALDFFDLADESSSTSRVVAAMSLKLAKVLQDA